MIHELQVASFVREKVVTILAMLARDIAQMLPRFDIEGDPSALDRHDRDSVSDTIDDVADDDLNERDVAEFLGSVEAMEQDDTLWQPDNDRWLPRSAHAGILQSSLDDYYRANDAVVPDTRVYGERLASDPLSFANMRPLGAIGTGAGRFTLNKSDPRWVLVLYAKRLKRRHGRAHFRDNTANATKLSRTARIVVVGDWGSGIPGAIQVADTMRHNYILPVLGTREVHVVHLGDVYYAGLAKEYRNNFLAHWPVHVAESHLASSWCLAGNHDMYAGGRTFFGMLARDARFAAQNRSSYFLLENRDWNVFGLDSAYEPIDYKGETGVLYGEQAAWFARTRAKSEDRKCLLLTHHQPFSAYDSPGEDFERRFRPVADAKQIDAWFWGHEHGCGHYKASNGIEHPVLLGHGGFPQPPMTHHLTTYPFRYEWKNTSSEGDLTFGFAVLDFDADRIDVELVDQFGSVQHAFSIS